MTVKAILGYDVHPGVSTEEHETWLFEVHAPDLLANPYLDRIVFNKVMRQVTQASGGTAAVPKGYSFYRIAEMHYASEEAYNQYVEWFADNPLPPERGPGGRTDFRFYLLAEAVEVTR